MHNLVENTLGGTASAGSFGNNIGISPNAFADTNEYDGINIKTSELVYKRRNTILETDKADDFVHHTIRFSINGNLTSLKSPGMVYSIHKAIAAQLDISIDDVSIANINYIPGSDGGLSSKTMPILNPGLLKRVGSLPPNHAYEKTFDYRIDYKIKAFSTFIFKSR